MGIGLLPASALAFGAGALLGPALPAGAALAAAAGGFLATVSTAPAVADARGSARLLSRGGLLGRPARGTRERILEAAGAALRAPERFGPRRAVVLLAGLICLGAGWAGVRSAPPPGAGILDGARVRFVARVSSDPRPSGFGWGTEAVLERVMVPGAGYAVRLRAWIGGRGRAPALVPGQTIAGLGYAELVGKSDGFKRYLRDRGVVAEVRALELGVLAPAEGPLAAANAARAALRRGAERALAPRDAGLLLGLAIGDTRTLDRSVEEDFRATGLTHLLAVSGANVAMVLAPVLGLAVALGLRMRGRFVAGLVAIGFFALMTRWEPSVLRAGVMGGLALLGVLSGRPRDTATLLGAAVFALLVADPALARSVGFQLSVAATAGIAALAGPIAERSWRLPRPLALAAGVALGAQLGVTPLLVARFGEVPAVTLAANLVAAPVVPLALGGGLLAAGLGLLAPPAASVLGPLLQAPVSLLAAIADGMAKLGLPWVSGGPWLGAAIGLGVLVAGRRLRRGGRGAVGRLALPVLAAVVLGAGLRAGPPSELTVTFLDVGQGDAAVVRTPEGGTALIDAGPDEREVAADLARLGVRRLDLAVATHAHADHVEGFPAVLARFRVGLLLEPGCPADSPSHAAFRRALRAERVPVRRARGGQRFVVGSLVVEILGPDRCSSTGPNDDSVVLRLRHGGATVLFPGDAERPAQEDLLDDEDDVRALVLKVPHHGGDTSLGEFFSATGARLAVVSSGEGNDYGHPAPEVLAALRAAGMRVIRTDQAGDVTVRFGPRGPVVESQR